MKVNFDSILNGVAMTHKSQAEPGPDSDQPEETDR